MAKQYWLMKSEPASYSLDDLARDGWTSWQGVRNYQARNFLRDDVKAGDEVLFYHSGADASGGAKGPGVAGIARVKRAGYGDATALDKNSEYYDARATKDDPVWYTVDLEFVEKFDPFVTLAALKANAKLAGMAVTKRGQRLSVQPVAAGEFKVVRAMGRAGKAR